MFLNVLFKIKILIKIKNFFIEKILIKMKNLFFGTAGIPISAKGFGTVEGIEEVRNLGLDAMELEFVRNINISEQKAPQVKEAAEKKAKKTEKVSQ